MVQSSEYRSKFHVIRSLTIFQMVQVTVYVYGSQFLSFIYISDLFAGGITLKRNARLTSFCSHAILQRY